MLLITEELRDEIIEWLKLDFAEWVERGEYGSCEENPLVKKLQDLLEVELTGSAVVKVVEVLSENEAVVVFPVE